jgi:amino acid permease
VPSNTYFTLVKAIIGNKVDRYLIGIIVIGICGNCISYLIIITKMISKLALDFGVSSEQIISSIWVQLIICFVVAVAILLPISANNKMSGFKYLSLFSLTSLVYIMFVLVSHLPSFVKENYSYERLNFADFKF